MEYFILNSYLKRKNENRKTFVEAFKLLSKVELILFFTMLISAMISLVFLFIRIENGLLYICILLELMSVSILYFIQHRKDINNSEQNIEKMDKKYEDTINWLNGLGFNDKCKIKQLCNRCKQEIEQNKQGEEKFRQFIDKIFTLFLIPIYAAIVTLAIQQSTNISDQMMSLIIIGIAGIILYILIFGLINFLLPIINSEYVEMDKMVKLLQGVLDRKYEIVETDIK